MPSPRRSSIRELEIELAEKRLKEYAAGVKIKKAQLEEAEAQSKERLADLGAKKAELEGIGSRDGAAGGGIFRAGRRR